MNDWLDYKGSGSARAYAANGFTGETIQHRAFGVDEFYWTPAGRIADNHEKYRKQKEAETRLLNAKKEQLASLEVDLKNARLNSEACTKKIIDLENKKKEIDQSITKIGKLYKDARQTDPLKAHQMFAEEEYRLKKRSEDLNNKLTKEKSDWSKYSNLHSELKSKVLKVQQEINNLEKSLAAGYGSNSN